jgi:3-hydroxyisobutyrate dehydrogenase
MKVSFCGLGRMGQAMARHVLDAGHDLTIWNRTPGRARELLDAGAQEVRSPAEAAAGADAVVLMLFDAKSVRDVLFGDDGVIAGASAGTLIIDSTTLGPRAARAFGANATERGLCYLDAPVTGSVQPATEGTLGVLVGAADDDFASAKPLLELWGDPDAIRHVGPVGSGNAVKLVVNQALGVAVAGLREALCLAGALGVDRELALDLLAKGPYGFTLEQKRSMIESGDFSDTTFSAELMAKDLDLAVDSSRSIAVTVAALDAAQAAVEAGHGDEDYAVIAVQR